MMTRKKGISGKPGRSSSQLNSKVSVVGAKGLKSIRKTLDSSRVR